MPESNVTIQLRSLAVQNRLQADFFELAADLHEKGYKTDQARIDAEVQKAQAAFVQQFTDMQAAIDEKTAELATLKGAEEVVK